MSSLVTLAAARTSSSTGMSISTSLRWGWRRTCGVWANPMMATSRTVELLGIEPEDTVLAGDVHVDVGLVERAEPPDRLHRGAEVGLVDPHRLQPHPDADLVDRALLDQVHDRLVGAVEEDVAGGVGDLLRAAVEAHVDDAVAHQGPAVGHLHLLGGGLAQLRISAARRDVHVGAGLDPSTDDLPLGDALEVAAAGLARGVGVGHLGGRAHRPD